MPAEPDGYDLQRQLDRLREDLKAANDRGEHHVTETGLAHLLARYDDRSQEFGKDIADERVMRTADIVAERDARKAAVADLRSDLADVVKRQRIVAISVVLPVVLFLANLVFLLYVNASP